MTDLRQALVRSCAEEGMGPRAVAFDPAARTYEAFSLGARTELKGTLAATNLEAAQAETTERWHWDRGDRLGIREVGQEDAPIGQLTEARGDPLRRAA